MYPKIIRSSGGKCCPWCSYVEGTYSYPNVSRDVYRRHRGCTCSVDYFPGDGRRQNVHSKVWYEGESEKAKENYKYKKQVEKDINNDIINLRHRRNKTGDMTTNEYADYKRELQNIEKSGYKQIILPKKEYAHVMNELNTNMSEEDRKHAWVRKPIGNYYYTIINYGFDNYIVVGKELIT